MLDALLLKACTVSEIKVLNIQHCILKCVACDQVDSNNFSYATDQGNGGFGLNDHSINMCSQAGHYLSKYE